MILVNSLASIFHYRQSSCCRFAVKSSLIVPSVSNERTEYLSNDLSYYDGFYIQFYFIYLFVHKEQLITRAVNNNPEQLITRAVNNNPEWN